MDKTIIRVRRGINGHKYSACDNDGNFLANFEKSGDVRKHWKIEIRCGQVELIRELDKQPDTSKIEETRKLIDCYLRLLSNGKSKRKK
jgi:hypothetical protein